MARNSNLIIKLVVQDVVAGDSEAARFQNAITFFSREHYIAVLPVKIDFRNEELTKNY